MSRGGILSRLARLLGALAAVALLAGCGGPLTLPTRAPLVAAPLGLAADAPLPPTFTPAAGEQVAAAPMRYDRLAFTATPTLRPFLPTRTPAPTSTPYVSPTVGPSPTATRYVSSIRILPPTDELGPSKLGLHVIRNNDPKIMEFVRQAQPAVVKAVDDLGFLAEVRQVSPRTITIGRHSVTSQDMSGNPEEAARQFVAQYLPIYTSNPAVNYWEGWNEPDPNRENMGWYARFEAERARQMARHGFRVAIGGFAAGVPEMDEFPLFMPAIEVAMQHDGILSLHEYSAPDMGYLYGGALPGYPAHRDRGSLTFRYRWFYAELLEPAGLVIPLVISEAGIDGIIGGRPGPAGLGWADFQEYWVSQGLGSNGVEAFINQLGWYDAGVRRDGYVIGFTVFTAGAFDQWVRYDINPILPQLSQYVVGQR